jgi:hypothetical protein
MSGLNITPKKQLNVPPGVEPTGVNRAPSDGTYFLDVDRDGSASLGDLIVQAGSLYMTGSPLIKLPEGITTSTVPNDGKTYYLDRNGNGKLDYVSNERMSAGREFVGNVSDLSTTADQ